MSQEPFVPIDVVAQHFAVSTATVRSWVKNKYIPSDTYVKLGNTYRFQLSRVTDALTAMEKTETETPEGEPILADWLEELVGEDNDATINLDNDL